MNPDLDHLRMEQDKRFAELEARLEKQMKLSLHTNHPP